MKKEKLYCAYCGQMIIQEEKEGKVRDFCPHCNTIYYENPLPVASCIVVNEDREVLLVKRKKDPYKNMWCLPIGFAESGESVHDAALRELEEEAGVLGEIIRLIDVDTVENYFYGSLAIVTYEVKMIGGQVRPGDDASKAEFFPINKIPELAWISNETAIKIYIELYKDTWAMIDSYKMLYPEENSYDEELFTQKKQKQLLSNILVKIIDNDINEICREWEEKIRDGLKGLVPEIELMIEINKTVLYTVRDLLKQKPKKSHEKIFIAEGKKLRIKNVALPEVLTAMALSRRSIWLHVVKKKLLNSPLEIYSTLELNNRIIFIYDRIIYYLTEGYIT